LVTARDFEFLVASIYAAARYDVVITKQTRDGGYDIVATKESRSVVERILIECKRTELPVGVSIARALMGALASAQATRGVLVSTSTFTNPTVNFAKSTARLELIDREELCRRLNAAHGPTWTAKVPRLVLSTKAQTK